MIGNPRKGLFLIIWLLFFILMILREYQSSWVPESFKKAIVEREINSDIAKASALLNELEKIRGVLNFSDYHSLKTDFPLFVYQEKKLLFWNTNDFRHPQKSDFGSEEIQYRDNGFNKYLKLQRNNEAGISYIMLIPLWKDVGIENQWLDKGSGRKYSFNWDVSDQVSCGNAVSIGDEIILDLCFEESKESILGNGSGIHLLMISLFLFALALSFRELKHLFTHINEKQRTGFAYFSLAALALFLIFEYSRRWIINPSPESVFFVVYPYLISFLAAVFIYLKPNFLKTGGRNTYIIPILIFSVYALSKSYWKEIYDKENFDLDLINFVRFEWNTLDAYLGLFGMSLFYYLITKYLIRQCKQDGFNARISPIFAFVLGLSIFVFEVLNTSEWYFAYLLIAVMYAFVANGIRNRRFELSESNIAYVIISLFILSFFITETTNYGKSEKNRKSLYQYANRAIRTQAEIEQKLLLETAEKISEDKLFHIAFSNPLTSRDIISQKIKKVYLDSYFDPFSVKIDFLNAKGDNLNSESGFRNLFYFRSNFFKPLNRISDRVYLVESEDKEKSNDYFLFIELKKHNRTIGYIVVEVFRDRTSPNSIFPKLLVDEKYSEFIESKYELDEIEVKSLSQRDLAGGINQDLLERLKGMSIGGQIYFEGDSFNALAIHKGGSIQIIKDRKSDSPAFSNFSIVFMVLSFLSLILYLFIADINLKMNELPFRRKIQFFMNMAFLLPLLVVSLAVLKFMNDNDTENIEQNYLEKVNAISDGIGIPFLDYKNKIIPERVFRERASRSAGLFSLDFFIYDTDGKLNTSSKEILWERGISNRLIDPRAYISINEDDKNQIILENEIDKFHYKIAYSSLYDLNNKKIGILGVPFYESGEELESRFIQLLSTVINIFVLSFIVFLVLSNRLTDWLMIPVLRLSDRIRITSFENKNEPLEWNTRDEIGKLVSSYNDMIEKLNESRQALARTEKEAAWREMAQQVAHEIKNPLTPMRLRLQQLIKKTGGEKGEEAEKLKNTLNSLLHQVDTLSEIANSFSEFARMPNPKSEKVNLNEVIELASNIYLGKKDISLNLDLPQKKLITSADENMLSRSIGNIILNGIQSVSDGTSPEINISLFEVEHEAEIRISDNGEGIDEEIQDRIFIPHFSTKSGGTGIGLALAKKTIESARGIIKFESHPEGTVFIIRLPLIED